MCKECGDCKLKIAKTGTANTDSRSNSAVMPGSVADLDYWKKRCLAAENYIDESPCDPDSFTEQMKAFDIWQHLKDNETS